MRESTAKNIKFESIADLYGTPREFDENTISMVPLKNLYTFENHPYRVLDDEKMMELVESIKENAPCEIVAAAVISNPSEETIRLVEESAAKTKK